MAGGFTIAADKTIWVCQGMSTPATQVSTGGGAGAWGEITGTLSDQSDLQTALDAKQATLVSATNIKTINGNALLGSGDLVVGGGGGSTPSYTLSFQALTSSVADGATIHFDQLPKAPTTTQGQSKIYIRKAGTIRQVELRAFSGTAGTNEAWVCYVRLNNTGDTQIASVSLNTNERVWTNADLNLAVTTSDYIAIKCVNPTWVTNPLTTIFGGHLVVEY